MKGTDKIKEMEKLLGYGELLEIHKVKVFIVKHEHEADYNIFFEHKPYEERNTQIISPGELVDQEYKADIKVLVVDQGYDAKIKIMPKNFPR